MNAFRKKKKKKKKKSRKKKERKKGRKTKTQTDGPGVLWLKLGTLGSWLASFGVGCLNLGGGGAIAMILRGGGAIEVVVVWTAADCLNADGGFMFEDEKSL